MLAACWQNGEISTLPLMYPTELSGEYELTEDEQFTSEDQLEAHAHEPDFVLAALRNSNAVF